MRLLSLRVLAAALLLAPAAAVEVPLVRCASAGRAFAAAWLAPAPLFLATRFPDEAAVEPASYDMFERDRFARKTRNATAFYVEHLSGLEHHVHAAPQELQADGAALIERRAREAEAAACGRAPGGAAALSPAVALVPFWRGYGGAAHSGASLAVRDAHLRATACAAASAFGAVAVGACADITHDAANATDAEHLAALQLPPGTLRVNISCGGSGTRLMYALLRHAQARLREATGAGGWAGWVGARYVFYTEGDQAVREDPPGALAALASSGALQDGAYLAPNRLEEVFLGEYGARRGPRVVVDNRSFVLVNRCDDARGDAEQAGLGCGAAVRRSRERARLHGCRRRMLRGEPGTAGS
jgi:hypothetical protein